MSLVELSCFVFCVVNGRANQPSHVFEVVYWKDFIAFLNKKMYFCIVCTKI